MERDELHSAPVTAVRKQHSQPMKKTHRHSARLHTRQMPNTRMIGIRYHPAKGREVYARKGVAPHSVLTQWRVQPASPAMAKVLSPHDQVIWADASPRHLPQVPMRDLRYHDNVDWYKFNHSSTPNCKVEEVPGHLRVVATQHIMAGEACQYHYGEPDPSWV
jgi:hypothetical protein